MREDVAGVVGPIAFVLIMIVAFGLYTKYSDPEAMPAPHPQPAYIDLR